MMIGRNKWARAALGAVALLMALPSNAAPASLLGEPCQWTALAPAASGDASGVVARLACGGEPVGRRLRLVPRSGEGRSGLAADSLEPWRARLLDGGLPGLDRSQMDCGPVIRVGSARPAGVLACRLRDGGWPHLLAYAVGPEGVEVVEGPPVAVPALMDALGGGGQNGAPADLPPAGWQAWLAAVFKEPVSLVAARDRARLAEWSLGARRANAQGRHALAQDLLRQALDLKSRLMGPDHPALVDTLMDLGLSLSNRGQFAEAQALLDRAERLSQRSTAELDRARLLTYIGLHSAQSGQPAAAREAAGRAVQAWRDALALVRSTTEDLSLGGDNPADTAAVRGELALALNLHAAMALLQDDLVQALASAREAHALLVATPGLPPGWRADVLLTLGRISSAQGRLTAAETHLRAALEHRRTFQAEGPASAQIWLALAAAYQREALGTGAREAYRQAWALLRAQPEAAADVLRPDDVVGFASWLAAASATLPTAERQAAQAELIEGVQWLRAGPVEQTVARASSRVAQSQPALAGLLRELEDAQRERDAAAAELAFEYALPAPERSRSLETALQARRQQAQARERALREDLRKRFPAFDGWSRAQAVPLADLQQGLQADELVIVPVLGTQSGWMLALDRSAVHLHPVALGRDAVGQAVAGLRRGLEIRDGSVAEFDLDGAHRLYRQLLAPLEPVLRAHRHLIVAASGPLASLPWSVLVTQPPTSPSYAQAAWLGRPWAVSAVPGLGTLPALRAARSGPPAPRPLLALGAPRLLGQPARALAPQASPLATACRDEGPALAEAVSALAALPDTVAEVQTVSRLLGADPARDTLLGEAATEQALRQRPLDDYRVLYFATHGLLPGELRCRTEPALVTTPPTQAASRDNDGLLEASEIAGLRLRADLVVLSACNTAGAGGRFGGDALSGLAEAFFYAGARSLVVSHWAVPSAPTAQLMGTLFERLVQAPSPGVAQALQDAQAQFRRDERTAHPAFWGAFSVVGHGALRWTP